MTPVRRVFTRARRWFASGTDDPRRRVGTWLCATAAGEPAGPGPEVALPEVALPEAGSPGAQMTGQPLDLVRADPARLLRLADQIVDQTMFGQLTDRVPANLLAGWTTALPVAVALAVRAHDLAVTSALLLAGASLRCGGHPVLRDATAFVVAQQQPDGGYGALPPDAHPALQDTVRVPLTLGCVWALAEITAAGATSGEVGGRPGLAVARPLLRSTATA